MASVTICETDQCLPADVEMILSAIEAGQHHRAKRRSPRRLRYRTQAALRLFSDSPTNLQRIIYTRDASPKGLGFLSPERLPLGYGGMIDLIAPNQQPLSAQCTILRCREITPGWYEGAIYFNREQMLFEA